MTLQELFDKIESSEFDTEISVSSVLYLTIKIISSTPAVLELQATGDSEAICERISILANREIDVTYLNPWDVALAAYLWIVGDTAHHLIDDTPNLFWALAVRQKQSLLKSERREVRKKNKRKMRISGKSIVRENIERGIKWVKKYKQR